MRRHILKSLHSKAADLNSPNARNSVWNTVDLLIAPALLLLSSPHLISQMGQDQFGFWMLLNSFIGLIGALNFGLGDATIKYAAQYQAGPDSEQRRQFAASLLAAFLVVGTVVGVIVVGISEWLVFSVFTVTDEFSSEAVVLMQLGGVWLGCKLFESGCVALVKGSQRYDLAARITIVENLMVIGSALVLTTIGFELREVLLVALVAVIVAVTLLLRTVKSLFRLTGVRPELHAARLREVGGFSFWAWLQGLSGSIFNQADKILIGASIGVSSLSVYVVCLQVGQLIHAFFVAAAAFLFPLTSGLLAAGDNSQLNDIFQRAMRLLVPVATMLTIFIYMASTDLLVLAFGEDFAVVGAPLLRLNAIAFGGLALSVVPYCLINGAGLVRINVIFAVSSALIIIAVLPFLLERFGLLGGGIARVINFVVIIPYLVVVKKLVLQSVTWTSLLRLLSAFVVPVAIAVLVTATIISATSGIGINLVIATCGAGVGGIISLLIAGTASRKDRVRNVAS